ncbi:MAG: PQQ-dependent sugar dehydrogenase, partial [Bacteroidota bacterium]
GIPPDNPFAGNEEGFRQEIYAYGLRNPWRFSFDQSTNRLWAADVGQAAREEINIIEKGKNYGWRIMEGTLCYNPPSECDTTGLTLPVWEYPRDTGRSVTGGYVYRGNDVPELTGKYIYGDFSTGRIWGLTYDGVGATTNSLLDSIATNAISSFGVDRDGEVYLCSFTGSIYRFTPTVGTSVSGNPIIPSGFSLGPNAPNPFNPSTSFDITAASEAHVVVEIRDLLGRMIVRLLDNRLSPGVTRLTWNAGGNPSGLYFARLMVNHLPVESRPLLLLR